MNILLIIISLFLGIFAKPAFALEINIEDVKVYGITVGETFPVVFTVADAQPDTAYYLKIYGGPLGDKYSIKTYNQDIDEYLSFNKDWTTMPIFYTDSSGNATVNAIAKIPFGKSYCPDDFFYCYFLYVDIADTITKTVFSDVPMDMIIFPPTITPTPADSLDSPSPTTVISKSSDKKQTPTLTPTPTPNIKIFGTKKISTDSADSLTNDLLLENPDSSDSAFIETGSNPEPIIKDVSSKKMNLTLLIILGSAFLFLIIPLIFFRLTKK